MKGLVARRPSPAMVVAVIALVMATVGTAFAALGKNTVGTKQLKKNAVTAAKIKKNAVTTAKIKKNAINTARIKKEAVATGKLKDSAVATDKIAAAAVNGSKIADGSVTGSKIADGSVTGADINAPTTPFSQVTARLRPSAQIPFGSEAATLVGNYAQPTGEDDQYLAGMDVNFAASCEGPRLAVAALMIDPTNPNELSPENVAAIGVTFDESGGAVTKRMEFAPFFFETLRGMTSMAPATTVNHSFYVVPLEEECESGSGITGSNLGVDVIGTKYTASG